MTLLINPPPSDNRCEICGTPVDDLQAFDDEFIESTIELAKIFAERLGNTSCVHGFITSDYKLAKMYRVLEGYSETSWECCDCWPLDTDEAMSKFRKLRKPELMSQQFRQLRNNN